MDSLDRVNDVVALGLDILAVHSLFIETGFYLLYSLVNPQLPETEILIRTCILVARQNSLVNLTEAYKTSGKLLETYFECLHFRLELGNRSDLAD